MRLKFKLRSETTRIILHATHTPVSKSNIEAWLRVNGRRLGLLEIGTHFLILQDGRLIETRPQAVQGSHCRGYNETSIGVMLAGGVDEAGVPQDNFKAAQHDTLRDLVEALRDIHGDDNLEPQAHHELKPYRGRGWCCPPADMAAVRFTCSDVRPEKERKEGKLIWLKATDT